MVEFTYRSARTYILSTAAGRDLLSQCDLGPKATNDICFEVYLLTNFVLPLMAHETLRQLYFVPYLCFESCAHPSVKGIRSALRVWDILHAKGHLLAHHGWLDTDWVRLERYQGIYFWPSDRESFPLLSTNQLDHARILYMLRNLDLLDEELLARGESLYFEGANILIVEIVRLLCCHSHSQCRETNSASSRLPSKMLENKANIPHMIVDAYGHTVSVISVLLDILQAWFSTRTFRKKSLT